MQVVEKVAVVGLGYVGLPLAMCAAAAGYRVAGFDVDIARVKRLSAGDVYVEDVNPEDVVSALASGQLTVGSDPEICQGFDVAVITVPTPLKHGDPDLEYVEQAARAIGRLLRPGATVILESTTYPGTTRDLVVPILESTSGLRAGPDFQVGYSPERIDPGNKLWTLRNTPKVVSGIDPKSLLAVADFYRSIVDTVVSVRSTQVAEMAKLIENTFRHVNIAMVNELAMLSREIDVDVWEAVDAAATKPYGFSKFLPGPGVGGHCLPVDPSYLSWTIHRATGRRLKFVDLANDVNETMPRYVVNRLAVGMNERGLPIKGSSILLLGIAYKKNTSDARESPSARVAELLLAAGARLRLVDPHVDPQIIDPRIECVQLTPDEISRADAIVLLTDHDDFDLTLTAHSGKYVFDCRNKVPAGKTVELL